VFGFSMGRGFGVLMALYERLPKAANEA